MECGSLPDRSIGQEGERGARSVPEERRDGQRQLAGGSLRGEDLARRPRPVRQRHQLGGVPTIDVRLASLPPSRL